MKKLVIVLIIIVMTMPIGISVESKNIVTGNKVIASVKNNEINFYLQDRLGSTNLVTDNNGNTISESKNLPFGETIKEGNERYGFTGKELDDSGLHYFGARYLDSDSGIFITTDPVKEGNPYRYVDNNPLKFVDPDGKELEVIGEGFFGFFGRRALQKDLNELAGGKNALNIVKEENGYFIRATEDYQGPNPKTFNFIKSLAEHSKTIGIRVADRRAIVESYRLNDISSRSSIKNAELLDVDTTATLEGRYEEKLVKGAMFLLPKEIIDTSFEDEASIVKVVSTLSGKPEILLNFRESYGYTTVRNDQIFFVGLHTTPTSDLAHELGHAAAYLRGVPDRDIPGVLDPNNPGSLGPAVEVENIARQEMGMPLRNEY